MIKPILGHCSIGAAEDHHIHADTSAAGRRLATALQKNRIKGWASTTSASSRAVFVGLRWQHAVSAVAMTRPSGRTRVFVGKDQASEIAALAEQMGRQSERATTLRYQAHEELTQQMTGLRQRNSEQEM